MAPQWSPSCQQTFLLMSPARLLIAVPLGHKKERAGCLPEPPAAPQQTDERRVQPVGDAQERASSMSLKSVHGVSAKWSTMYLSVPRKCISWRWLVPTWEIRNVLGRRFELHEIRQIPSVIPGIYVSCQCTKRPLYGPLEQIDLSAIHLIRTKVRPVWRSGKAVLSV